LFITFGVETMKEIVKNIWSKSKFFLSIYFIFLVTIALVLVNFSKLEGAEKVNATWTFFQDKFFKYFTYLGGGQTALFIVVVLALFFSVRKSMVAFSSFIFTALITQFLKHVIFPDAMRPFIGLWREFKADELHLVLTEDLMKKGNSFPSGHTTSAFSVFLILALFVKKPIWGVVLGIFAILASYSRVYLSQHYFEDIFFGSVIGVSGTLLVYSLFEKKQWLMSQDKPLIKWTKS